jgi:multidrug efflux pump subunit AcrB
MHEPFKERDAQGLTGDVVLASIDKRLAKIDGAFVITILPPPINGIGNAGGFKMMLEDKKNLGPAALEPAAQELAAAANADPRLSGVFTPFTSTTPNLYADIDRVRAAKLGVPAQRVFEALQVYLQAGRRRRRDSARRCRSSRPYSLAADPDDLVGFHPGRGSARGSDRRWR